MKHFLLYFAVAVFSLMALAGCVKTNITGFTDRDL